MTSKKDLKARQKAVQASGKFQQFIRDQIEKAKPFEDRLVDILTELIHEAFQRGDDIPGVPIIAEALQTSTTTTAKALRRLVSKGKVVRIGSGVRVRYLPNTPEFFEE